MELLRDGWTLQLVSDALQPVADAECDAAGRGMMTSSCGCLAPLHVHLWVPWQRARRAHRGKSLALCAAGRRAAGYHADAASCFSSQAPPPLPPLSLCSSLPCCCRRSPLLSSTPPLLLLLHVPSSANQSPQWGQGIAEPPFQCGAAASPQS